MYVYLVCVLQQAYPWSMDMVCVLSRQRVGYVQRAVVYSRQQNR